MSFCVLAVIYCWKLLYTLAQDSSVLGHCPGQHCLGPLPACRRTIALKRLEIYIKNLSTPHKCKETSFRGEKKFIHHHFHHHDPQYLFQSSHPHSQYTPAFSLPILQSSFSGILLNEGLERSGFRQSPIRHPTRITYFTIPILGLQKP